MQSMIFETLQNKKSQNSLSYEQPVTGTAKNWLAVARKLYFLANKNFSFFSDIIDQYLKL